MSRLITTPTLASFRIIYSALMSMISFSRMEFLIDSDNYLITTTIRMVTKIQGN